MGKYEAILNNWVGIVGLGEVLMETLGTKGRIILMWDKKAWKGQEVESGCQTITCKCCLINYDLVWFVTIVYVYCDRNERRDSWEKLGAMRSLCKGPWVVCGDLNIIRLTDLKHHMIFPAALMSWKSLNLLCTRNRILGERGKLL